MLTCKEIIDFLMRYLDGELSPAERAEFERHLEVCPPCMNYIQNYREVIRLGNQSCQDGGNVEMANMPEDLVKAILESRRRALS